MAFKAELDGLGDVGFIGDLPGYSIAPQGFTNVENFRMYAGHAEKVGGYVQTFKQAEVVPLWLGAFASTTKRYLIHAGKTGAFADDGSARYPLCSAPLSGGLSNKITAGAYNGVFFFNNGVDQPQYWGGDTGTPMAVLTNWPTTDRAFALRKIGYYLVALNITRSGTNYPYKVMWSDKSEPGTLPAWADLVSNDAGEVDEVGDGSLVDALELGGQLVLYYERSMCMMRWIGGNDVFSFEHLPDKYGMLAPGCGAVVPGVGHVVLTKGDVIAHSGNGARSIIDGVNRKWLLDNLDANYAAVSFVTTNDAKNEVWICFPETGQQSCTKALVWNWTSQRWSKRTLPGALSAASANVDFSTNSWDSQTTTWDAAVGPWDSAMPVFSHNETNLFIGTADGKLYAMDTTTQAAGVSFTGTLERTGLNRLPGAEGLADRVKDFSKLWLSVEATAGTVLTVYFGASYDPDVAPSYSAGVTFTVGTDRWVDSWANGTHLAYKITAAGSADVRFRRVVLEVSDGGEY